MSNKSSNSVIGKLLILMLASIGKLPLRVRQFMGQSLGFLFSLYPTRDRHVAELQLKLMLGSKSRPNVSKVYSSFGQTAFESLNLAPFLSANSFLIDSPNAKLIEEIKREKKPTIALTAHLGNWDLLAAYICSLGIDVFTFGRRARYAGFQTCLEWLRSRYGVHTIWREGSASGVRRAMQLLSQGKVLAALIDQDTRVRSVPIPFFGKQAATPVSIVELGKRTGAQFVSAFIVRDNAKYQVLIERLDSEAATEEILSQFNSRLEGLIRRYPEQWVWFHKRWRTVSTGGKNAEYEPRRLGGNEYIRYLEEQICNRSRV